MIERRRLDWEDITVGLEVTPLHKVPSTQVLVKWAGASGDFNPLHYEDAFAVAQGVGKPIVHGQLKVAWLVQMLTDWVGRSGAIRKLSCQFRGMDHATPMKDMITPVEDAGLWCRGKVARKYVQNGEPCVECDIWIENSQGVRSTVGNAIVALD